MTIKKLLIFPWLLTGCAWSHHAAPAAMPLSGVALARVNLEAGNFYEARKITGHILSENPHDPKARDLMDEILAKQSQQHRKLEEAQKKQGRELEIKTYLERARTLVEIKEYDEALSETEKVFLIEPHHALASKMVDQIKVLAIAEGRNNLQNQRDEVGQELKDRVEYYKGTAQKDFEAGKWGNARAAAQKVLLLAPDDAEAAQLLNEIQKHGSQS